MFGKRKRRNPIFFDKTGKIPVIRASICTGERVAGFKEEATRKFEELMLIRNEADLEEFMSTYGVKREEIRKEW